MVEADAAHLLGFGVLVVALIRARTQFRWTAGLIPALGERRTMYPQLSTANDQGETLRRLWPLSGPGNGHLRSDPFGLVRLPWHPLG
jgi:hypothetical protein